MIDYKRTQTNRGTGVMAAPMRDLMFGDFDLESLVTGLEVLHFGEGNDWATTFALSDAGAKAYAYDPYSKYDSVRQEYKTQISWDLILSAYVYNVMPYAERMKIWRQNQRNCAVQIWAVRADKVNGEPYSDGVMTKANTFQKSYTLNEARNDWPNATVISYQPGRWITLFETGLLYPRNLSVPVWER